MKPETLAEAAEVIRSHMNSEQRMDLAARLRKMAAEAEMTLTPAEMRMLANLLSPP